jgi:sensor histidine kinase YesM
MAKKTIEVRIGEDANVSLAKEQFAQLIERYKVQNPVKYELKKEALEARLASMQ